MKTPFLILLSTLMALTSCNSPNQSIPSQSTPGLSQKMDDLNSLKREFVSAIFQGEVSDSPFDFNYSMRTVFFSKDIVSLLSEVTVYDNQPEAKEYYEGKTYCKINDTFTLVSLNDLFPQPEQLSFLYKHAEKVVRDGGKEICGTLENNYLASFVVDKKYLITIFQPDLERCEEGTFVIKIPLEKIEKHWNPENPIAKRLPAILESKNYESSWGDD